MKMSMLIIIIVLTCIEIVYMYAQESTKVNISKKFRLLVLIAIIVSAILIAYL